MTYREANWNPVIQVLVSVALAVIAAYGGVKAGMAESRATVSALSQRITEQDDQITRIEDKVDWLVRHQIEVAERGIK